FIGKSYAIRAVSERVESVGGFPNRLISRNPIEKPSPSSKPFCAKSPNGPSRASCAPSKPAPKSSSPRNVQITSNPVVMSTIQDDCIPLLTRQTTICTPFPYLTLLGSQIDKTSPSLEPFGA